jgi:phosphoglucomutase
MENPDALAMARTFIAAQVEPIKAGDIEAVKAGLTDRLKDRVTAEDLAKARAQLAPMTIDDLVASVEDNDGGMKLKMKNGRTLTTLVRVGDAWKADTLWFR